MLFNVKCGIVSDDRRKCLNKSLAVISQYFVLSTYLEFVPSLSVPSVLFFFIVGCLICDLIPILIV